MSERKVWEPCYEGCPGYGAFDSNRKPHSHLVYTHDPDLEVQRCDECDCFDSDESAFAQWVRDGRPLLGGDTEQGVALRAALRQLVSCASVCDLPLTQLQTAVAEYFIAFDET